MKSSTGNAPCALLLFLLTACAAGGTATPPATDDVSPSASAEESLAASADPTREHDTPAAAPESAAPSQVNEPPLALDSMVRSVADNIAVRETPTTDGSLIGHLPAGSRAFVVAGPESADGYQWMMLAGPGLPPASGCATFPGTEITCPGWLGWAAIGDGASDDLWFVDDPSDCPDPNGDSAAIMLLGDVEALHCYSGEQLTLTGWLPADALHEPISCLTESPSLSWLYCSDQGAATIYESPDSEVGIEVYVDPATGAEFTSSGIWPIVTGHLDDPAAQDCDEAITPGHPIDPRAAVLFCRTNFVAELVGAVGP